MEVVRKKIDDLSFDDAYKMVTYYLTSKFPCDENGILSGLEIAIRCWNARNKYKYYDCSHIFEK